MEAVQPLEPNEYTVADLEATPDDGIRYELIDGQMLVTPVPAPLHQIASIALCWALKLSCPAEYRVLAAPVDYRPTKKRSLQPDVLVVRKDDVEPAHIQEPPLLLVEVLSPSTRSTDLILKRALYQQAGVPSYWLFDPDVQELTVLELEDGVYVERARVKGDEAFETTTPYDVRVVPAELVL